MADKRASIKRLIITLTFIGAFGSLFLAFVFSWTNPYILEHEARAREEAIFTCLPGSVDYEEEEIDDHTFYTGIDEHEQRVGIAVEYSVAGYQGFVDVMVGVDPEAGEVIGAHVLNHEETPGLGARITEDEFLDNFRDLPVGDYEVVDSPEEEREIEGIAGATISAEAVKEAVSEAGELIMENYGGGN
ncbi:RnfABCDGE type electron transport complex subunit G [Halarsenatibacter silvermanii]|uniref:Ion-translocating oxidoreductase complex subunit G n=1 Tax=Halarsenatibacter silvermanii TaxID=321763 RepID=A0A1G9P9Y7_9FIRM|nr:RnfABCDGE type electron transport complex subunit G [Halarsenatibacter silvermanii]SDL95570.1 electron transport complex protein RnfG [Halarsenatibacter silvermanii]